MTHRPPIHHASSFPGTPLQALLIGIDHHPRVPHIDLRGAVADAEAMRRVLAMGGVADDAIRCLLSPGPQSSNDEPECSDLPTYSNMIREIRSLGRRAAAFRQHALLYYSGHGSWTSSLLPSSKETDECLVPCDVGTPGARWLRDVELTFLLDEMLASGLSVTCIVDACHSAGIMRHHEVLRARRVYPGGDLGVPEVGSDLADLKVLQRRWQAIHQQRTHKVKRSGLLDMGWLSESVLRGGSLTLLAACRQREVALEFPVDGTYRGGMTYFFVRMLKDALEARSMDASVEASRDALPKHWPEVHGRLTASLKQLTSSYSVTPQHPVLEGRHSDLLFPSSGAPNNRILVKSIDGDRVLVGAGRAWGLRPGSRLTSVPYVEDTEAARLVVRDVAAQEAWAQWLNPETSPAMRVGEGLLWNLLGDSLDTAARHGVTVHVLPSATTNGGPRKRRVLRNGRPIVPPTAPNDQVAKWLRGELTDLGMRTPQWRVDVQDGRCRVRAPDILGLLDPPPVAIHGETDIQRVAGQLQHLNLWQHFRQLKPESEDSGSLTLQLAPQQGSLSPEAELEPGPSLPAPVQCVVHRPYLLGLTLEGYQNLHCVLLALGDDGSMTWLYPPAGSGEELEPGHRLWIRWSAQRPGQQRLKVIATTFPLAVSAWSLPPVEKAGIPRPVAGTPSQALSAERVEAPTSALSDNERFYFTHAHRFWAGAHLDVDVVED